MIEKVLGGAADGPVWIDLTAPTQEESACSSPSIVARFLFSTC